MLALAHGFTFAELYSAKGIAKLDRVFLERLKGASPALASRLEAARAAPDSLDRKAESKLLLELAPHLEGFIAKLFGIAAECARLREEHLRLADEGEGLAGIVEMGLPLGPSIVHEVRTADGRALKVTEPRAAGAQPRAPGSAVRVRTLGTEVISIFPATG